MTHQILNNYEKYIKYKIKYINLKNSIENKYINQQGGYIQKNYSKFILDNNLDREYNIFGYIHSRLNNCGCFY